MLEKLREYLEGQIIRCDLCNNPLELKGDHFECECGEVVPAYVEEVEYV